MLKISDITLDVDDTIKRLNKRGGDFGDDIRQIIALDKKRKQIQFDLDETLALSNKLSQKIGGMFKQKEDSEKIESLKAESNSLKSKIKIHQKELDRTQSLLKQKLYSVPNIPHQSVPSGTNEDDNQEVFRRDVDYDNTFDRMTHWNLVTKYRLIDFELGNKISGAGFPVYCNMGAKLQRCLINYFLDQNTKAGYTEYQPPLLINEASGYGTGQLPDKEGQMYHVGQDNLYLIPTSEVPITNFFRDTILDSNALPIKCTAYTPCFRREAGSYGSHVRGLNRLHQFDKVEIVRIEDKELSYEALEMMKAHIQSLLENLGLPYRILRLCGGDLGFTSALTFDFEVFSVGQNKWLEVSSVSNFETYQSNRLKLRIKQPKSKPELAHTLNGSALALPRIIAALLELNQNPNYIEIPKVLVPYFGKDRIDLTTSDE